MSTTERPETMRAIWMEDYGDSSVLELRDVPLPAMAEDRILVRVTACGVCGHDTLSRRGLIGTPKPNILGHEIAGVVAEIGSEITRIKVGDRVGLSPRITCGTCPDCLSGRANHCRRGGMYGEEIHGGYAEYVVAGEANAVVLPDAVDDATAAIVCCAIGTGLRSLRMGEVKEGDVVLVTGAGGGVGVHTIQLAVHMGATVVALTGSPEKEQALRDLGAADVVVRGTKETVRACLRKLDRPRGADAVIEITGAPTFGLSVESLAPHGRLVLVGNTEPGPLSFNPGLVIVKELVITGSAHILLEDLEDAFELVASGAVKPVAVTTAPLEDCARIHEALDRREIVGRIVLVP
jgi:D-arabinose 1-dehydrogenase-like Zn-dependent alcohol dehydrogenase